MIVTFLEKNWLDSLINKEITDIVITKQPKQLGWFLAQLEWHPLYDLLRSKSLMGDYELLRLSDYPRTSLLPASINVRFICLSTIGRYGGGGRCPNRRRRFGFKAVNEHSTGPRYAAFNGAKRHAETICRFLERQPVARDQFEGFALSGRKRQYRFVKFAGKNPLILNRWGN